VQRLTGLLLSRLDLSLSAILRNDG
jgi:hypothetical protein